MPGYASGSWQPPLVPTLCVGTHGRDALRPVNLRPVNTRHGTQSVLTEVPTRSVGTRNHAEVLSRSKAACARNPYALSSTYGMVPRRAESS